MKNNHSDKCETLEKFFNNMGQTIEDVEEIKDKEKIDFNKIEPVSKDDMLENVEEVQKKKIKKYIKCMNCGKKGHINCFYEKSNIDCDVIFKNVFEGTYKQM
jgi:hypothetical protein